MHKATAEQISKAKALAARMDAEADALELDTPEWRAACWEAQKVRGWIAVAERTGVTRHPFRSLPA